MLPILEAKKAREQAMAQAREMMQQHVAVAKAQLEQAMGTLEEARSLATTGMQTAIAEARTVFSGAQQGMQPQTAPASDGEAGEGQTTDPPPPDPTASQGETLPGGLPSADQALELLHSMTPANLLNPDNNKEG